MPDNISTPAPAAASESTGSTEGSQSQEGTNHRQEAETPQSDESLVDGSSYEELEAALDDVAANPNRKPKPQAPPRSQSTDEEQEENEDGDEDDEDEDGHEPPAESEEATEEGEQKPLPKNFRLNTKDPKRAQFYKLLRKNPDADPIALAEKAGYALPRSERQAVEQQQEQAEHEQPEAADPLKGLRDEITALREQKKKHREDFEFDKADEIGDQIIDKIRELDRAERDQSEQQSYQQEFESSRLEARTQAVKLFPDTAKAGTPQFKMVQMAIAHKRSHDPDFLQDPSFPLRIVEELQAQFPDVFRASPAPPAAPGAPRGKVTPRNPSRPLGEVVAGNSGATPPATRAELEQDIDSLNFDELVKLAEKTGSPVGREARRR